MARVLQIAARSRLNILISGGTGSGKTTLLNAVSQYIDRDERVITIEDAVELRLQQPHVVQMETRPPNIEGVGQIPQRELVRNALRMRPDRIIVGEVRGPEAFDMLQAMNTGHDGSMSTVHANSPRDALYRLENMVMMANLNLPLRAIRMHVASALNLIVHIERMRDGIRRVQNIAEIAGMEGDIITARELFTFQYRGERTTAHRRDLRVHPDCDPISLLARRASASTGSCSTRLASGEPELYQQLLLAALGSTILFGAALVWAAPRRAPQGEPRAALKSSYRNGSKPESVACDPAPTPTAAQSVAGGAVVSAR